jgi:hypothetical protein
MDQTIAVCRWKYSYLLRSEKSDFTGLDAARFLGVHAMDKKTILVTDDAPSNLILLNNLLCKGLPDEGG